MIKSGILLIGISIASGALARPATNEPPLQSESVAYGDLNVGTTVGQAALRHRIQRAAGRVCDIGGMPSMEDFSTSAQCYRRSYAEAVREMDQVVAASRTGAILAASAIVVTAK